MCVYIYYYSIYYIFMHPITLDELTRLITKDKLMHSIPFFLTYPRISLKLSLLSLLLSIFPLTTGSFLSAYNYTVPSTIF